MRTNQVSGLASHGVGADAERGPDNAVTSEAEPLLHARWFEAEAR
jgi:hypothetical protein